MLLAIDHPERDRCHRCRSTLSKVGYVVKDSEGVRKFICTPHLIELLHACQAPLQTIHVEE